MTTSHHTQSSVTVDGRQPKLQQQLRDLAVAAVMIALVLGLAFGVSWLLPLEFAVPRPR